jgi:hypothetical protein
MKTGEHTRLGAEAKWFFNVDNMLQLEAVHEVESRFSVSLVLEKTLDGQGRWHGGKQQGLA